jgi:hypothetical protein
MEQQAKHTPGPWAVVTTDSSTVEILGARELVICEVGACSVEDEANASLIAAAPELFKALSEAVEYIPAVARPVLLAQARAALAKAVS